MYFKHSGVNGCNYPSHTPTPPDRLDCTCFRPYVVLVAFFVALLNLLNSIVGPMLSEFNGFIHLSQTWGRQ